MNKLLLFLLFLCCAVSADAVYDKNKKANKLYEQGKYEEALSLYEEALLESPDEKNLAINKGSALYRLQDFAGAQESYKNALSVEDKKARADLHYNMGNVYNMHGDQLAASGNQEAMEKYKAARDSYIKSLDLNARDRDAKWNLQLTQMKIKQMEQQKKQQQNNKDQQDKDKQNQDQNKDGKQDNKDKDKQQKDQQDNEKKENENKQQEQKKEDQQEKPQPKPKESEKKDMEKEEAMRLLRQYADDDKELNKPQKKMKALMGKKPEKDW